MKTKRDCIQTIFKIFTISVIFILISVFSTLTLSGETKVVFVIDEQNKFNKNSTGSVQYSAGTDASNFPADLNDSITQISISYSLTGRQSKADMELTLCISAINGNNPGFRVKVNNNLIGDYLFTAPNSCNTTIINKSFNQQGDNVILIENTNTINTSTGLSWRSLTLSIPDYCEADSNCSGQYCPDNQSQCKSKEPLNSSCSRNATCQSSYCVHNVCRLNIFILR